MPENRVKIILKPGKEQSVKRFHPWIFSGAIAKITGKLSEGDLVAVYTADNQFLALGHYQIGSIAVRIIYFEDVETGLPFWKMKVENAWKLRKSLGFYKNEETNVFRLIHAEGDGMPGLVVDYYNGTAVMQMHSVGMYLIRETIAQALKEVLGEQVSAVYDKSSKTLPFKAEISPQDGYLAGSSSENEVTEYGLKFRVDWHEGQKTGFFIDQRENRFLVQQYSKDRDVLNMFCYTGGFSFFAMKGGAHTVHSVDASAPAIELTNQNVEINFSGDKRHKAFVANGLEYLKDNKKK